MACCNIDLLLKCFIFLFVRYFPSFGKCVKMCTPVCCVKKRCLKAREQQNFLEMSYKQWPMSVPLVTRCSVRGVGALKEESGLCERGSRNEKSFCGCSLATGSQRSTVMLQLLFLQKAIGESVRDLKDWLLNFINISVGLMALQGRKQTKWKQSQQSIEHRQSWEPVLFFSHCGALGDFISNSPPAFGFYLCQVNWTEESGGKLEPSVFWIIQATK